MQTLPPNMTLIQTADGSPTLDVTRPDGNREMMHHQAGALSETLYVYGDALNRVIGPVRAISVGLGIGYNELLTLACAADAKIWSFETDPFLQAEFRAWAHGQSDAPLFKLLQQIASLIESHFKLTPGDLQRRARHALANGALELRGSFPQDVSGVSEANLVYYDAYSNKMTAELWDEDTLVHVLDPLLGAKAWLATYAATGTLNRALKRLGFRRIKKAGFRKRRESTLAFLDRDIAVNLGEVNLQPVNRALE